MKKFYLFLSALLVCTLSAHAGTKLLYYQTFETASDVASTGWVSPSLSAGLAIGSDDYGKFLSFSIGANNDRSCHLIWGSDLIKTAGVTSYSLSFDFSATAWGNSHTSADLAVMSDETTCTKHPNSNFRTYSKNWLFDLTQLSSTTGGNAAAASGNQVFAICGDSSNTVTLSSGAFYTMSLDIDTLARTVDYAIYQSGVSKAVCQGVYSVPEGTDMNATGLYYLGARYSSVTLFDNIKESVDLKQDVANKPTATLKGINNHQRVYSLGFISGETLHYTFNDGLEQTASYADCDGVFIWSNNPNYDPNNEKPVTDPCQSGTLKIWTTSGSATSDIATVDVDNDEVALPATTASIAAVEDGYGKSYKLIADNSTTPLAPKLFIDYTFTPKDGGAVITGSDLSSGSTVTVPSAGTLELTTKAFGYQSTTSTVVNDHKFAQSEDYNLAHWTADDATKAGFTDAGTVSNNYSNYGRYYWYTVKGTEVGDTVKTVYSTINSYKKAATDWKDSVVIGKLAFTAIPAVDVSIFEGIGLYLDGQTAAGKWISSLYFVVNGLTDNDFIAVSGTSNYGSTSLHPYIAGTDPDQAAYLAMNNAPVIGVYKGTSQFSLYRVSDILARVQVFKDQTANDPTGIKTINTIETSSDAPVYNISGVRVNKDHLLPGIYIQNGKKFIVK